eukprot:scaffold100_cov357-Prasinococcus_capsulatus_cf.AAC.16
MSCRLPRGQGSRRRCRSLDPGGRVRRPLARRRLEEGGARRRRSSARTGGSSMRRGMVGGRAAGRRRAAAAASAGGEHGAEQERRQCATCTALQGAGHGCPSFPCPRAGGARGACPGRAPAAGRSPRCPGRASRRARARAEEEDAGNMAHHITSDQIGCGVRCRCQRPADDDEWSAWRSLPMLASRSPGHPQVGRAVDGDVGGSHRQVHVA